MKKIGIRAGIALLCLFLSLPRIAEARDIPSSRRSRHAIARVRERLAEDFEAAGLEYGAPLYIRIFKEEKELELWIESGNRFSLFRTYGVCTYGMGSLGPKTRRGDGQAPEGFYFVAPNRLNPSSQFHLAFDIGYPNAYDWTQGWTGGSIMVHGSCVSIGCFAMRDSVIEEIYAVADTAFRKGQPFFRVHIFPFRMTREKMEKHGPSEWEGFWKNLKEGYDFFIEQDYHPPNVRVRENRYVFD